MKTMTVGELKARFPEVLEMVRKGEEVIILAGHFDDAGGGLSRRRLQVQSIEEPCSPGSGISASLRQAAGNLRP